jgi:hypothetical protein
MRDYKNVRVEEEITLGGFIVDAAFVVFGAAAFYIAWCITPPYKNLLDIVFAIVIH